MNWTKKIIKSIWYKNRRKFCVFHESSFFENRIRFNQFDTKIDENFAFFHKSSYSKKSISIEICYEILITIVFFIYSDFMLCCDVRVQNQSSHEILKKKKFQKSRFYQNAFEIKMNQIKKKFIKIILKKWYECTWLSAWLSA